MPQRIYCSEQNGDEPMIGTADPVDVWVLLEYRPAWKARALEQSRLDIGTRSWLDHGLAGLAAAGLKGRPQLIRQPEIDRDEVRLLVGVPGSLLEFSGRGYGFLCDLDLAAIAADPSAFPAVTGARYFVCTNGQRDLCCARHGLPAYAALRERVGDRVWQVTHLGGHRFAPNVLVLPQGAMYGRVTAERVDDLVREVDSGRLEFSCLRGRSWYPPAAQAAEALSGRSDLELLGVHGDDGHARVDFRAPDGALSVAVRRSEQPLSVQASCGDENPKVVHPFLAQ